jgi:hypothetical protein
MGHVSRHCSTVKANQMCLKIQLEFFEQQPAAQRSRGEGAITNV